MQSETYSKEKSLATAAVSDDEAPLHEQTVPAEVLVDLARGLIVAYMRRFREQEQQIASLERQLAAARAMLMPADVVLQ